MCLRIGDNVDVAASVDDVLKYLRYKTLSPAQWPICGDVILTVTCCNGQSFTELEYLLLGLVSAVPSFLIPMLFAGKVSC